jgi:transcription elongation factor Elf1
VQQQDGHRTLGMTDSGIYCPRCSARVVQKGMDGQIKLRTKLLAIDPETGKAKAVCRRCGADVPVDIHAGTALVKALGEPRLVIKKK